jgi:two-component system, chemotaxis family, CheB/CheR fusion protein
VVTNVSMTISTGDVREFEVQLTPLHAGDRTLGTTVTFTDVTVQHRVQKELEDSKRELETTNEELQSTNEELETTNEELQSTNEELETMNDELRQRTLELNEVNAFLETILTSMGVGVAVLDRSLAVQVWNAHSSELWGLRSDEAEGENLLSLDVGLPVEKLSGALRDVLNNGESRVELRVEATNRRGRPIDCRIVALPLSVDGQGVSGTILLMEELGERTDGG